MDSPDVFVMASDPESGNGNLKCLFWGLEGENSSVTTRGSDWVNPGTPSSRWALPYNGEPKAWCKSVFTVFITI